MEITELEPKSVWDYFAQICQIPHPSKHEAEIIDYVAGLGKSLGLETTVDEVGNVIIKKPATAGMEQHKTVILQAHLDMVPEKTPASDHDFEHDPIAAHIDGEWVTADNTTLGADNGIGMAMILAILSAKDLKHGPITAVFTVDEETSFTGIHALQQQKNLAGDFLISLDVEQEGIVCVGSAGGTTIKASAKSHYETTPVNHKAYQITVANLQGGHSGNDIHLGRGNANKILTRILWNSCQQFPNIRLADFHGGLVPNAIPRDAYAIITVAPQQVQAVQDYIAELTTIVKIELQITDPNCTITITEVAVPKKVLTQSDQAKLLNTCYSCPTGVISYSQELADTTETSMSLGVVNANEEAMEITTLQRGIVESKLTDLDNSLISLYNLGGWESAIIGNFFLWEVNFESQLLQTMKKVYAAKFQQELTVTAAHCGLECGLFTEFIPNLQVVSIGPTIVNAHSPNEKLEIAATKKTWEFLVAVLEKI